MAMGRKSREHSERRDIKIAQLEEEIKRMSGGDAHLWSSRNCPPELRESALEDIITFESIGTGTSLFEGLQQHGLDLPHPDKLNEEQSERKVREIMFALTDLHVFLMGYEEMTPRQLYLTLWHETLWEGCYFERKNPYGATFLDVSHKIPRSEILQYLDEMAKASTIH
jgi:hypothetical protein